MVQRGIGSLFSDYDCD